MILNSTNFAINIYNPSGDLTTEANPYITVTNSSGATNYFFIPMNSSSLGLTYTVNDNIYLTKNNYVVLTVYPFNVASSTFCVTILADYRPDPTTGVFELVSNDSQTNCVPLFTGQSSSTTLQLTQQTHIRTSGKLSTNTQQKQRVLPYNDMRFNGYDRTPNPGYYLLGLTIELASNFEEIDITYNNYMPLFGSIGGIWHSLVGIVTIVFQIGCIVIKNRTKLQKCFKGLPQEVTPNNLNGDKSPQIKVNGSPSHNSSIMNGDLSPEIKKNSRFKR
jgi:hypothetical protein